MADAITTRQSIDYAYDRPSYYRNRAREDRWGEPVYFTPATNGYDVGGYPGPGYLYGYPYSTSSSRITGDCTWWAWGRCFELNGTPLPNYGNGMYWYERYDGDKEGGPTIQNPSPGDLLCWGQRSDGTVGHVQVVEAIDGDYVIVSESYDGVAVRTACVVQRISISNPTYGSTPFPYQGILHTGGGGGGGQWVPWSYDYTADWTRNYGNKWTVNGVSLSMGGYYTGDDGSQDEPFAPIPSDSPNRRKNEWNPITCRTEERTLYFEEENGVFVPKWTNWVEIARKDNHVDVGQYDLPGWVLEWPDD